MQPTREEHMAWLELELERQRVVADAPGLTLEGAPGSGAAPGAAETDTSEFELGLLAPGPEASAELETAAAARASARSSSPSSVGSDVGIATARLGSPTAVAADDLTAATVARKAARKARKAARKATLAMARSERKEKTDAVAAAKAAEQEEKRLQAIEAEERRKADIVAAKERQEQTRARGLDVPLRRKFVLFNLLLVLCLEAISNIVIQGLEGSGTLVLPRRQGPCPEAAQLGRRLRLRRELAKPRLAPIIDFDDNQMTQIVRTLTLFQNSEIVIQVHHFLDGDDEDDRPYNPWAHPGHAYPTGYPGPGGPPHTPAQATAGADNPVNMAFDNGTDSNASRSGFSFGDDAMPPLLPVARLPTVDDEDEDDHQVSSSVPRRPNTEPGLPPRLPAAGPANRSAVPDMFTAPTEREHHAVIRVAQAQAAAQRGKRPTGHFSLNTAHPAGSALPSRQAQRLNERASMAHWEAMEELQRQFPQQSGNVRNFYTALALVRPHVMEAYATGTNSAGVQRHQTPQALDPTTMAFVRDIARLNIGLAIQYANDVFYGTHLTIGSFPEEHVMVDPSASVPTQGGSWPSLYEGLDVIRDAQGNLVHVAGGIRHGTIGRFDAARMQAMGVQGPIHPVQVDFAARMPTHVYCLHDGDRPSSTPFKIDTRAYFRGLTEGERRARALAFELLLTDIITMRIQAGARPVLVLWGTALRDDLMPYFSPSFQALAHHSAHPEALLRWWRNLHVDTSLQTDATLAAQARSLGAVNPPQWLMEARNGSPITQAAFEAARRASLAARSAAWLSEQGVDISALSEGELIRRLMSHLGRAGGTAAAAAHEQMAIDLGITGTTAFLPATFAELMAMHARGEDVVAWAHEQRVAAGRAAAAAHQAMGELLQIPGGTAFLPATFDELLQMATRGEDVVEWAHRQRSNAGKQGYVAANTAVRRRGESSLASVGAAAHNRLRAGPRRAEKPAAQHALTKAAKNRVTIDKVVATLKLPGVKPTCVFASAKGNPHGKMQITALRNLYRDDTQFIADLYNGDVTLEITDPTTGEPRAPTRPEQTWMLMTFIVNLRNNKRGGRAHK